jgi:hypothetical protein
MIEAPYPNELFKSFRKVKNSKMKNIEEVSWEELNCFRYSQYPNDLILTTTATREEVAALWEQFTSSDMSVNFDEFVKLNTGKPAISGCFDADIHWIQ